MKTKQKTVSCHSCAILIINGVICHEIGCPDAWQDETRKCRWCGSKFKPATSDQRFCEESCAECY